MIFESGSFAMHRDDCDCDWCEEGRALGRAMAHVSAGRTLMDAAEWRELCAVLDRRPDWGSSHTTRRAVLRAKLRWEWPNVARVRVQ